jgi:GNAT superfamily N-acetyltransferase
MTHPLIRFAVGDDANSISALFSELGHPASPEDVAARLERFARLDGEALIAEIDGEVVGVAVLSLMQTLHRPTPVGRISALAVAGPLQGKGIGRALVAAAETRLAERGCQLIEVTSNQVRVEAHRFYERLGYERTSYRFFKPLGAETGVLSS